MVERVYFLILVDGGFFFSFFVFCLFNVFIRWDTFLYPLDVYYWKKKKEVAEQTVAFFLWFPQLWNYGHWEFPRDGSHSSVFFSSNGIKASQFLSLLITDTAVVFFPPWWWVILFSSSLKLNSLMPGPTAVTDSVPALALRCSASGENENTGDTIWMHSDFFDLFFFCDFFCWLTLAVSQEWLYRIVF